MGGLPWSYFVPYRGDIEEAFEDLKQKEFEEGRYSKPDWPFPAPKTIDEALMWSDEDEGTHSVLDTIGVAPLDPGKLIELFGTKKPSRAMVEADESCHRLLDFVYGMWIGSGVYVIVYEGDLPSGLFFVGFHW